jgi:hypothetical protein
MVRPTKERLVEPTPQRAHGHRAASTAFVAVLVLTVSAVGLAATSESTVAPSDVSAPTIAGTAQVGKDLAATAGDWLGREPIAVDYRWRRCDENGGSCSDIAAVRSQTYTLRTVDVGNTLRVVVTARYVDGFRRRGITVPTAVVAAAAAGANGSRGQAAEFEATR